MQKVISLQAFVPVRREPSETSEMVTQILFGETATVYSKQGNWSKVSCDYDNYPGWCDSKCLVTLDDNEYQQLLGFPAFTTSQLFSLVKESSKLTPYWLSAGSTLYNNGDGRFVFNQHIFNISKYLSSEKKTTLSELALSFQNIPYLWGGRSAFGIDCSGFSQIIYKIIGIKLPRDASQQAECGEKVTTLDESKTGDLAFFSNGENKIVHVGILLDKNKIIHASGNVHIDEIDINGILNNDGLNYFHKLSIIKRIIKVS